MLYPKNKPTDWVVFNPFYKMILFALCLDVSWMVKDMNIQSFDIIRIDVVSYWVHELMRTGYQPAVDTCVLDLSF